MLVVEGYLNKQVASELGAAEKTIKIHRARVMEKMKAGSLAELVRLAEKASFGTERRPRALAERTRVARVRAFCLSANR